MELVVFIFSAAMILIGGLGVVLRSHPVHAALSLVLTLFGVAVIFVSQEAHFLAAVQVIVYAGAIVVLFLFVIMLLGVDRTEDIKTEPFKVQRPLAIIVGVGLIGLVTAAVVTSRDVVATRGAGIAEPEMTDPDSNIRQLSRSVFGDYVVAFELTSVLLVVAVVGTVLLTRKMKSTLKESHFLMILEPTIITIILVAMTTSKMTEITGLTVLQSQDTRRAATKDQIMTTLFKLLMTDATSTHLPLLKNDRQLMTTVLITTSRITIVVRQTLLTPIRPLLV